MGQRLSRRARHFQRFRPMRLFVLEPQHYDAFIGALDAPPPAGAELKALMKKRPPVGSVSRRGVGQPQEIAGSASAARTSVSAQIWVNPLSGSQN